MENEKLNTQENKLENLANAIRDYFKEYTNLPESNLPEEESLVFFADKIKEGTFLQEELSNIISGTKSEEIKGYAQMQLNKLEYYREENRVVKLSDLILDDAGYINFTANIEDTQLEGVFRVYNPIDGANLELVDIQRGSTDHSIIIREEWDDIENYLKNFSRTYFEDLKQGYLSLEKSPILLVKYSENENFQKEQRLPLAEANLKLFSHNQAFQGQGYDKVEFEIFFYNKSGQVNSYQGRYDIGSEKGDLIAHIERNSNDMLNLPEEVKNEYIELNGKEKFEKDIIGKHQKIVKDVLPLFKESAYQNNSVEEIEELPNSNIGKTIETNIGEMPIEDYLDIVSIQNGFSDYEHLKANGYELDSAKLLEQSSADQELSNYVSKHPASIKERPTVVINAYGGAGAGKTTACLGITEELKKAGYVAEYVQEYAKELVWEENWEKLDGTAAHQFEILKEQVSRMDRLYGKVDFIVTDAPILLNKVYNNELTDTYERSLVNLHNQYQNFNFIVERDAKNFEQKGRMQNLQESIEKDKQIEDMLKKHDLYYGKYRHETTERVVDNAVKNLDRVKKQYQKEAPKEKEAFQAYAYAKNSSKATVVNGTSKEEILKKINGWNNARTQENKFVNCNIAELNTENGKYEGVRRFEIATGKDITPTYLALPVLEKEKFKELTQELNANGAKFNPNNKKWYITPEQDSSKFQDYLPGQEPVVKENETSEKFEWSNIKPLSVKMQYVVEVAFEKQNTIEKIVIETDREMNAGEVLNALENSLSARNPEHFSEEQLEVLDRIRDNPIFTEEKKNLLYNQELTPGQMQEIKYAFESGLSAEQVSLFAKPNVEAWQMNFYQYGMEHGCSFAEMEKIVAPALKNDDEWSQRKNTIDNLVTQKRGVIAKDIEKSGFQAKSSTIKKIERLNFLTRKGNSVKDISNAFRNPETIEGNQEVKNIIKDIGNELKNQELLRNQVPVMEA